MAVHRTPYLSTFSLNFMVETAQKCAFLSEFLKMCPLESCVVHQLNFLSRYMYNYKQRYLSALFEDSGNLLNSLIAAHRDKGEGLELEFNPKSCQAVILMPLMLTRKVGVMFLPDIKEPCALSKLVGLPILLENQMSPVKRICVFEHSVMTNCNCACPAIKRGQGSGYLSECSS